MHHVAVLPHDLHARDDVAVVMGLVNVGDAHGHDAVPELRCAVRINDGHGQLPVTVELGLHGVAAIAHKQISHGLDLVFVDQPSPLVDQVFNGAVVWFTNHVHASPMSWR